MEPEELSTILLCITKGYMILQYLHSLREYGYNWDRDEDNVEMVEHTYCTRMDSEKQCQVLLLAFMEQLHTMKETTTDWWDCIRMWLWGDQQGLQNFQM